MRIPFPLNAFWSFWTKAGCTKGTICTQASWILFDSIRISYEKTEKWVTEAGETPVYSSSGPLFKSQQPYGDSQLSVNSSPKGSIILFSPLQAPGMHVVHKHTCRQNIHTLKNKFFLKLWIIEKWVIALFTTNYRQPSLEVRCVHGSKSVPVGEHLNTGQSLYSALPNSVFWCDRLTTWYLVRHFGLAFITIPWHTYREKRWVFKVVFICF